MPPLTTSFTSGSSGACAGSNITCIASTALHLINDVFIPVLFAVAFVTFLYGIAKTYVLSKGESSAVQKGHKIILWGLIGFVVMISLWGLVNVVSGTLGLGGGSGPQLPQWTPSTTW